MTVNCGGSENDSACRRMIRWAIAWKVPPVIRPPAGRAHAAARDSMSSAARLVKVSSRIRLGGHALLAQPGRPGHQRAGLPGAGPGQHQQRPARMRRRPALLVVQPVKHIRRLEHGHECNQVIRHRRAATLSPDNREGVKYIVTR